MKYEDFLEMKIYKHGSLKLCPDIILSDGTTSSSKKILRELVEDKLR